MAVGVHIKGRLGWLDQAVQESSSSIVVVVVVVVGVGVVVVAATRALACN